MPDISSDLHRRIRKALLDCGPLQDDNQLRAVFAHPSLRPWRHSVPQASDPAARADAVIALLTEKHRAGTGENALVLFMRVSSERLDPGDECHHRLAALADELEKCITGKPVNTRHPTMPPGKEVASLQRQLEKHKHNLLTIEERKADFIDPRSVPPDLVESERLVREEIAEVEARLAKLES